jgi:hypothetical protein
MTDATSDRLAAKSVVLRKLPNASTSGSNDPLSISVSQLVGQAPEVPAFPRRALLASLDPIKASQTKRLRGRPVWIALVALVGGVGFMMPRLASQNPSPDQTPMMIIERLPKGLTLTSLTEDRGGTPYVASSFFEYSGPQGDTVTLIVELDQESADELIRAAGDVPPKSRMFRNAEYFSEYGTTVLLEDQSKAVLATFSSGIYASEQLRWQVAGFELTLSRNTRTGKGPSLLAIANQMKEGETSDWTSQPVAPFGYKEIKRVTRAGELGRQGRSFTAAVVNEKGKFYSVSASDESVTEVDKTDSYQIVSGRRVKLSPGGISWVDGSLYFSANRDGAQTSSIGEPPKRAELDPTLRKLIAATKSGTMLSWNQQMNRFRAGFTRKSTTKYRGIDLHYYLPAGEWTEDLVCLGKPTLGGCVAINGRPSFSSLPLADGRWIVVGPVNSIALMDVAAAQKRNAKGGAQLKNQDGVLDVITVGLQDIAVSVVGSDKSYLELDAPFSMRINRPRIP